MRRNNTAWVITSAAVLLAVGHTVWPNVKVDAITVTLFVIAVLPWLAPIFKAVELPGGLKVEYAQLEKAGQEAQSAGVLGVPEPGPERGQAPRLTHSDDPNLALAALRIELEKRLRAIAERYGIGSQRRGVSSLLRELGDRGLISQKQSSILIDLLPTLNAAVHGADVDPRASAWAAEVGPQLLAGLEFPESRDISTLMERWRKADGAEVAEVGYELSEAAVQAPQEFLQAMTADKPSFQRWIDRLPYHTFTTHESQNRLQDDLYAAYYERLRTRMSEAIAKFSNHQDLGPTAKRITDALANVTIHSID